MHTLITEENIQKLSEIIGENGTPLLWINSEGHVETIDALRIDLDTEIPSDVEDIKLYFTDMAKVLIDIMYANADTDDDISQICNEIIDVIIPPNGEIFSRNILAVCVIAKTLLEVYTATIGNVLNKVLVEGYRPLYDSIEGANKI